MSFKAYIVDSTMRRMEVDVVNAREHDALAARLAEAERLLTRVIVDGDFVSENVLYVYAETFNAIEKFLGRTAWELVKIAADSASGVQYKPCGICTTQSWCETHGCQCYPVSAVQPERCCLDYPRCDCNSPPEPDGAPALQPCGHPWKAQHDSKCILCSSPGVTP